MARKVNYAADYLIVLNLKLMSHRPKIYTVKHFLISPNLFVLLLCLKSMFYMMVCLT